ncbi:MAG: GDSL-type esterase/lipase family protein [Kiritimatiellaeota bacterium]|nr:GDSL-type esterase/lipase family protein [Kiritimatiellota bacterium]
MKIRCSSKLLMIALALMIGTASVVQAAPAKVAAKPSDPCEPAQKKDTGKFMQKHEEFLKRGKAGPIGVLFLGDSITEGWVKAPEVWGKFYKQYDAANFGIGGDRTEHVLWRIANGELDDIHPKVVILMIGTNNTGSNDADSIAAADKKIVKEIQSQLPDTKVLVLAVFPRGPRPPTVAKPAPAAPGAKPAKPTAPKPVVSAQAMAEDAAKRMAIISAVNKELAKLDDGKMVRYLDINPKFLGADGKIPNDVMPDQLHPNAKGYQIWADAMQPLLAEMLK